MKRSFLFRLPALAVPFCLLAMPAHSTDKELLDILLGNGAITQEQYDHLINRDKITPDDIIEPSADTSSDQKRQSIDGSKPKEPDDNPDTQESIEAAVARQIDEKMPVRASHGSSGFRLESRDGNWQTNLLWRAQIRYTNPTNSDPRQLDDFSASSASSFEPRRLRMKIGGHAYQPWLKYYFEVDLQPARDVDSDASRSGARAIDWRIDVAKWDWGGIRIGQWKVDLNRERGDSSGRQQFVERSIVNRVFTLDRQIGVQLRGRAFKGTPADLRWFAGVFNGEGRGVRNASSDHLYMGRLQWNFLGRDLPWRQTDVEYTDQPTGSLAIAGFTNTGSCTRWSSSGCGNLDGFDSPLVAEPDQFRVRQAVQEFAFKYRGLSVQQELHRKFIDDRVFGTKSDLTGAYLQAGYFFHNLNPAFPAPLELAARYAYVEEPNEIDRSFYNEREEFTIGANWFFNGHGNKLTLDFSNLTIDDPVIGADDSRNRVRLQWDVSF